MSLNNRLVQVPQAKKSPIKNNPKPKDTSLAVNLQNNRTNQVQNNEAVFRYFEFFSHINMRSFERHFWDHVHLKTFFLRH